MDDKNILINNNLEFQIPIHELQHNINTTFFESIIQWLKSNGLVFQSQWGNIENYIQTEVIDTKNLRSKTLDEIYFTREVDTLEDTYVNIRLRDFIQIQLQYMDENNRQKEKQLILPTFIQNSDLLHSISKTVKTKTDDNLESNTYEDSLQLPSHSENNQQLSFNNNINEFSQIIGNASASLYSRMKDDYLLKSQSNKNYLPRTQSTYIPGETKTGESYNKIQELSHFYFHKFINEMGEYRRLLNNLTLAEAGIRTDDILSLYSIEDPESCIESKLTRTKIYFMEEGRGHGISLDVSIDSDRNLIERWVKQQFNLDEKIQIELLIDSDSIGNNENISTQNISTMPTLPIIKATKDIEVYSGPDKAKYTFIGILQAGKTAVVKGKNTKKTWWQIVFPEDKKSNAWVETLHSQPYNTEKVTTVNAPIVWKNGTLHQFGLTQKTQPFIRVIVPDIVDIIKRRFEKQWRIRKIDIQNKEGLLIRFSKRDIPNPKDIYLRIKDNSWCFQLHLLNNSHYLKYDHLNTSNVLKFINYIKSIESEILPVRFVFDRQRRLLLELLTTNSSYRQLDAFEINPLDILQFSAQCLETELEKRLIKTNLIEIIE